jgi:P27 family predicted phage terminase small subunit
LVATLVHAATASVPSAVGDSVHGCSDPPPGGAETAHRGQSGPRLRRATGQSRRPTLSVVAPSRPLIWEPRRSPSGSGSPPGLDRQNLLKPEDYAALLQHCQTWQTYISAIRQVRAEGVTVLNPQTGCPRKNPALGAAETAGAQLLASCREFGLTPSSEQRLAAAPADDGGDPFAG